MDFTIEPLVSQRFSCFVFIQHEVALDFSVAFFQIGGNTSRPFGVLPVVFEEIMQLGTKQFNHRCESGWMYPTAAVIDPRSLT
jgi:hypothetical protein